MSDADCAAVRHLLDACRTMGHATELVALLPAPLPPWGVLRRARHCCDHRSLTHRLSHPGSNAQSPYLSMAMLLIPHKSNRS